MKKVLLFVCGLPVAGSICAQTPVIANGGFESWTSVSGSTIMAERPENWYGSDRILEEIAPLLAIGGYPITPKRQIFESPDAHSGSSSLEIMTRDLDPAFGPTPGLIANGPIEINMAAAMDALAGGSVPSFNSILNVRGGTAISGKQVDSIVAYIKTPLDNEDSAAVIIEARKVQGDSLVTIGAGFAAIPPNGDYEKVVVIMNYANPDETVTDSLAILFVSSFTTEMGGSTMFNVTDSNIILVDDAAVFTSEGSTSVGNIPAVADLGIKTYPNPAKEYIDFDNQGGIVNAVLNIYGTNGQVMHQQQLKPGSNRVDITRYAPATYYFEIVDIKANKRQTGKFVK